MYTTSNDILNCFGAINMSLVFLLTTGLFLASSLALEDSAVPEEQTYVNEELFITKEEKLAFEKFKSSVFPNITQDFLRSDLYLLRVLRARNLDTRRAIKDILEFESFLRRHKMETILSEDFSDMADFPYFTDAVDKEGRPVLYIPIEKGWNVRRVIQEGRHSRFVRYSYKIIYEIMMKLYQINMHQPNVTRIVVAANMNGFNIFQHSCPTCIRTYMDLYDVYERFVPGFIHEVLVINAPEAYRVVLEMVRPSLAQSMSELIRVFGRDRSKWKKYMQSRIDTSELPWDFD